MLTENEIRTIIQAYIGERRAMEIANFEREDLGAVVRYTPLDPNAAGFVCYTRIAESELDGRIAEQVSYFQDRNLNFEWKVYDFDEPKNLKTKLLDHGFEEGEPEVLMVFDLARFHPKNDGKRDDIEIRRIKDDNGIEDVVRLQESVWGRSFPWLFAQMRAELDISAIYCAYRGDTAVGSGWIEFPSGSQFADIHGGAVNPDFRGAGIYTRLLDARTLARKKFAGVASDLRYKDITFPLFRHVSLQKYRAMSDLAARSVFLASTAYDSAPNYPRRVY